MKISRSAQRRRRSTIYRAVTNSRHTDPALKLECSQGPERVFINLSPDCRKNEWPQVLPLVIVTVLIYPKFVVSLFTRICPAQWLD
jgi:hypothetical protein